MKYSKGDHIVTECKCKQKEVGATVQQLYCNVPQGEMLAVICDECGVILDLPAVDSTSND